MNSQIRVYDDVMVDPDAYRSYALAQTYADVVVAPAVFKGIAECHDTRFIDAVRALDPSFTPRLTFFRKSPLGQPEPNFIHTDRDMGDVTAILYLNPDHTAGDGTTFWRHRQSGAILSDAEGDVLLSEWLAWRDRDQWEPWQRVEAKFNRMVVFDAPLFHSRSIDGNYGTTDTDARLIQVLFGTKEHVCL